MSQKVSVIGLDSHELQWIRMLVALLRHPDPLVPELACQALLYLSRANHSSRLPLSAEKNEQK